MSPMARSSSFTMTSDCSTLPEGRRTGITAGPAPSAAAALQAASSTTAT